MFQRLFSHVFPGLSTRLSTRLPALLAAGLCAGPLLGGRAGADSLPTLHLRQAPAPPQMPALPARLQDPATAGGWYGASPTWFGNGGLAGDRNHVEVLATYDSKALYLAFLVIDRSPNFTWTADAQSVYFFDRNAVWVQTPAGRSFCFSAQPSSSYGGGAVCHSAEMTSAAAFDPTVNTLPGWSAVDSTAGSSWQEMLTIPWSAMASGPPAAGASWRFNVVNYNQYGPGPALSSSTLNTEQWAPGGATQPGQWGTLAFDNAQFTPPAGVSPEATVTLRPATGFGGEVTLSPGDNAATNNAVSSAGLALTQSDWNDWDPVNYELKEFLQFDLSMIPPGRTILGATLDNYYAAPFESDPTDLYVHVERLASAYDPGSVTMLTSPLPLENGDRELVHPSPAGWVNFDVSAAVAAAYAAGSPKVSLALAGSSGDTGNGKGWAWSWGRADWSDQQRPRLHITFGQPGVVYPAPLQLGSLNSTSAAGPADKNKLTNGTFRYGATEGVSNTTYWQDPGSAYVNGRNVPLMTLAGDVNAATGDPAMRLQGNWDSVRQTVPGVAAGRTYTLSAWAKASTPGQKLEIDINYEDANGNSVGSSYSPIACDSAWDRLALTTTAPAGATQAVVGLKNWGLNGPADYDLYSDAQLEAGTSPTAYSETMGVYYPARPRTDGRAPLNAASFVSQSVPSAMTPGQSYPVSVTYTNTGNTPWTAGTAYRLGAESPQDNTLWTGSNRVALPAAVAPGQSVTFSFSVTAPSAAGTYPFQWRMVQDGVQWFGGLTPAVSVSVGATAVTAAPAPQQWLMSDPGIGHVIGRADADGWSASTAQDPPGYLQYGPYTTQVTPGAHTASWALMVDNNTYTGDGGPILELQVYDSDKNVLLAVRDVNRAEWTNTFQYQTFPVPFTLPPADAGDRLEFRDFWYRKSYVREQKVAVQ